MICPILATATCFLGLMYLIYSAHFLPRLVVVAVSVSNILYMLLIIHLFALGLTNQVPDYYHSYMYLYAIVNFSTSAVVLFYLKKRRNRWPCVFGERGKNFPDLEKALRAFDLEVKRVNGD